MGLKEKLVTIEGLHNAWKNFMPGAGDIVFVTINAGENMYDLVAICDVLEPAVQGATSDGAGYVSCDVEFLYSFSEFDGGMPRINALGVNPKGNTNFHRIIASDAARALYHSSALDENQIINVLMK